MNKQQPIPLVITGVATGSSSTKIQLKPKPILQKPKYQPPPLKQAKKQSKQQQPQQQQKQAQQPLPKLAETKVVYLTESVISDQSEPDQQFVLRQEALQDKEIVQIHVPTVGQVTVRYSHYKESFPIKDGQLLAQDIDAQYCLSHVFKGDYKLILKTNDKSRILENIRGGWAGCENQQTYWLEVEEDPIQEEWDRKNSKPYEAPKDTTCPMRNRKVELISQELKGMSIKEIEEKGDKFKDLIEARDLEDILFK